jgi:ketosteroid isomerase-like protein
MRLRHWIVIALLTPVFGVGCGSTCPPAQATTTASKADSSQRDTSTAEEVKAVEQASERWDELFNAGDLDGLMERYVDDAVSMPPGRAALKGATAIRDDLQELLEKFDATHKTYDGTREASGDLAIERAKYRMELVPKDGSEAVIEEGKHIVVYRRQEDESWKVLWEIWNVGTGDQSDL